MRRRGEYVSEAVNQLGVACGVKIGDTLARLTPIDTGAAKSNWQPSLGGPSLSLQFGAFVEGKYGSTDAANEAAVKKNIRGVFSRRKDNEDMYLSNSLRYISRLESSYSSIKRDIPPPPPRYQSGFVQVALARGLARVRNNSMVKNALNYRKPRKVVR
tara:strand:+ start:1633 stop:2106 length:474 start_codon:yes stop_codon:yes gene_type:complete